MFFGVIIIFLSKDYYVTHLKERSLFCKEDALMNLQVNISNEEALQYILDNFNDNTEHFEWIKDFDNCLYTGKRDIYEEYINHFNEQGLKNLKKKIEKNIKKMD